MIKTKIFPPKIFFPNLETWLRACFCQNCVCNFKIFYWKAIRPRDVA